MTIPRRLYKSILIIATAIGIIILSEIAIILSASADPLPAIKTERIKKKRIAILPHSIPIYFYKKEPFKASYDVLKLKHLLLQHASSHPYFEVIHPKEIEEAYENASLEEIDAGKQAEADMGFARNFMANMDYDSAIPMLKRIIDNYSKSLTQYTAPHHMAHAYQLLAYAYIEKYRDSLADDLEKIADPLHPARLAFLELIRLAPYLMMLEGRQSEDRVTLYDQALELFLENPAYRRTPQRDATALAHRLSADILIFMRIVHSRDTGLILEMDFYDANSQSFEYRHVPLHTDSDPEILTSLFIEDATLVLNEYYDCIQVEPIKTEQEPFTFYGGFLYHSFISHPTIDLPHGTGFAFSVFYRFSNYFFIRGGFEFTFVMQDGAHTLAAPFEIYSFPFYVGISYTWKYFRPYFGTGFDFSFSSPYTIVTSEICKTFGLNDRDCNSKDITRYNDVFAFNISVLTGLEFIKGSFSIILEAFIDVTAYPTENVVFRYPFGVHAGVGYHF